MSQVTEIREVINKQMRDTVIFSANEVIPSSVMFFSDSNKAPHLCAEVFPIASNLHYTVKSIRIDTNLVFAHGLTGESLSASEIAAAQRHQFYKFLSTTRLCSTQSDVNFPDMTLSTLLGYQYAPDGTGNYDILVRRGPIDGYVLPDPIEIPGGTSIKFEMKVGETFTVAPGGTTINGKPNAYLLSLMLFGDVDRQRVAPSR